MAWYSGRGGARPGGGGPFKWKHGETKQVRLPIAILDKIMEIARKLDNGEAIDSGAKSIDLSNVKVYKLHGREVVRLVDLVATGHNLHRENPPPLAEDSLTAA